MIIQSEGRRFPSALIYWEKAQEHWFLSLFGPSDRTRTCSIPVATKALSALAHLAWNSLSCCHSFLLPWSATGSGRKHPPKQVPCFGKMLHMQIHRFNYTEKEELVLLFSVWSEWQDSNLQPDGPKPPALPAAPHPDIYSIFLDFAWKWDKLWSNPIFTLFWDFAKCRKGA